MALGNVVRPKEHSEIHRLKRLGWSTTKIATACNRTRKCIRNHLKRKTPPVKKLGRKPLLSRCQEASLVKCVKKLTKSGREKGAHLVSAKACLRASRLVTKPSARTMRRILAKYDLKWKKPLLRPRSQPGDQLARRKWARGKRGCDFSDYNFFDLATFYGPKNPTDVSASKRCPIGGYYGKKCPDRRNFQKPSHKAKYNFALTTKLGGFLTNSSVAVMEVPLTYPSQRRVYDPTQKTPKAVRKRKGPKGKMETPSRVWCSVAFLRFLADFRRRYPRISKRKLLVDNDRVLSSKMVENWTAKNGYKMEYLPKRSPDLMPLDWFLWPTAKASPQYTGMKRFSSRKAHFRYLEELMVEVAPRSRTTKLGMNMKSRCAWVEKNHGAFYDDRKLV